MLKNRCAEQTIRSSARYKRRMDVFLRSYAKELSSNLSLGHREKRLAWGSNNHDGITRNDIIVEEKGDKVDFGSQMIALIFCRKNNF